jgi:hypothetical protein
MKMNDAYPSTYVKADQITSPVEVVIDRVELCELGEDRKPVVFFQGKDAGVVLSKSRFGQLVEICQAEDSDDWRGSPVILTTEPSFYAGKPCRALKFERSARTPVPAPAEPAPVPAPSAPGPANDPSF